MKMGSDHSSQLKLVTVNTLTDQDKMAFMLNAGGFDLSVNRKIRLIFRNSFLKNQAQKAGFPTCQKDFNSNISALSYENVTAAKGIIERSKIIWEDWK